MADRFRTGDTVRTTTIDPAHHTRLPRYTRGATGTVIGIQGAYPLPDDRSRGIASPSEAVYTVSFRAIELFGHGDHDIAVGLWESYLQAAT